MRDKNVDTTERNKENCSPPHGDNDIGVWFQCVDVRQLRTETLSLWLLVPGFLTRKENGVCNTSSNLRGLPVLCLSLMLSSCFVLEPTGDGKIILFSLPLKKRLVQRKLFLKHIL